MPTITKSNINYDKRDLNNKFIFDDKDSSITFKEVVSYFPMEIIEFDLVFNEKNEIEIIKIKHFN